MRVDRSPIRLNSSNLSKPILKRLPAGSIVQGKIMANSVGESVLLLGNEKIPVKLSSNLVAGSYEFQIIHENKNIIFKVLGQKTPLNLLSRYDLPTLSEATATKLTNVAKFILANGFSLSKTKLLKILTLLNGLDSDTSWFEVIFLLNNDSKKERASLKKMHKKIIALLRRGNSDSSVIKSDEFPNIDRLKKTLRELIVLDWGCKDNRKKMENGFPKVNFILFPLKIADREELIPIIFLTGGEHGDLNHLFCELELQAIGSVKLFLRSDFNEVSGTVYCQDEFVANLSASLSELDNIRVEGAVISDADIFQWPFELLLEMEAESNGFDSLT